MPTNKEEKLKFSKRFVREVKENFPEEIELHVLLDEGSWMVRAYLAGANAYMLDPNEVLAVLADKTKGVKEVRRMAKRAVKQEALCDEWEALYAAQAEKLWIRSGIKPAWVQPENVTIE